MGRGASTSARHRGTGYPPPTLSQLRALELFPRDPLPATMLHPTYRRVGSGGKRPISGPRSVTTDPPVGQSSVMPVALFPVSRLSEIADAPGGQGDAVGYRPRFAAR